MIAIAMILNIPSKYLFCFYAQIDYHSFSLN